MVQDPFVWPKMSQNILQKKGGGGEMGAIVKKFKIFNLITFKTRSIQMQGLHINCFLSNKFTILVYINDS